MESAKLLISKLSIRLAQYCDALGYCDEDDRILKEVNDYLGYQHVTLSAETPLDMPERYYQYHIEVQFKRQTWARLCLRRNRKPLVSLSQSFLDALVYEWEVSSTEGALMETTSDGMELRRILRVRSWVPLNHEIAWQIASMASASESKYQIEILWLSRIVADGD